MHSSKPTRLEICEMFRICETNFFCIDGETYGRGTQDEMVWTYAYAWTMIEHQKYCTYENQLMESADVAGLEPHGEMLFIEISTSWTLDGQLKKQKWQLKTGPFAVQIMHDAVSQLVSCVQFVMHNIDEGYNDQLNMALPLESIVKKLFLSIIINLTSA